jgi:hypothetical protein
MKGMPSPERLRQLFGALKCETAAVSKQASAEGDAWRLFWEQFKRSVASPPDPKRPEP